MTKLVASFPPEPPDHSIVTTDKPFLRAWLRDGIRWFPTVLNLIHSISLTPEPTEPLSWRELMTRYGDATLILEGPGKWNDGVTRDADEDQK